MAAEAAASEAAWAAASARAAAEADRVSARAAAERAASAAAARAAAEAKAKAEARAAREAAEKAVVIRSTEVDPSMITRYGGFSKKKDSTLANCGEVLGRKLRTEKLKNEKLREIINYA